MALAVEKTNIELEILKLKRILYLQAKYYDFELQHPEIQSLSKRLDELILIMMKEKSTR